MAASSNGTPIVDVKGLTKEYKRGETTVAALRGIDLTLESGSRTAIMGPSGCGKSTLLALIGGLDRPTSGTVAISGRDIGRAPASDIVDIRRNRIAFILQTPSLLPMLTAVENIELPLALKGIDSRERRQKALELLEAAELPDKAESLPDELSGGQQQRVCVMRALVGQPQLILADEPAGSLDSVTGEQILNLISKVTADHGVTLLMVTHDDRDAQYTDHVIRMRDGAVVNGGARP